MVMHGYISFVHSILASEKLLYNWLYFATLKISMKLGGIYGHEWLYFVCTFDIGKWETALDVLHFRS